MERNGPTRHALPIVLLMIGCSGTPASPDESPPDQPLRPPICAVESPELCLQDGIDLYNGLRGEQDRDTARSKFELACAGGDQRGCTWLGIALTETTSSGAEQARAVGLWEDACADEVMMACTQLGSHLMALAWQQADRGDDDAARQTFQVANSRLKRACGADDDEVDDALWTISVRGYACGLLASSYEHGFGLEPDLEIAYRLNATSCSFGWPRSCAQLGYFHEEGLHVRTSPQTAADFYRDACEQGDPMGCHNLADALLRTDGDRDRARELLRRACESEYPGSCERLETLDDEP